MAPYLAAAALITLSVVPAVAQDAQCFQNDYYLVIAQQRIAEVGSDFIVRPPARGKIACVFETQDGDIRIGEPEDPLYFTGLAGKYLVLSRSTGPDGNVVIYDLDAGAFEPVIDVPADDEVQVEEDRVTFWQRVEEGTAKTCPEYAEHQSNGFGSVIAEESIFDPAAGTLQTTGRRHCSNTQ
jgi:hypothetical protein